MKKFITTINEIGTKNKTFAQRKKYFESTVAMTVPLESKERFIATLASDATPTA